MKLVLISCGWFFVALAAVGVFVPLLPTVPFLLLATACFAKSSERFHQWLLSHHLFGDPIRAWHETRSIPKKSKYIALCSIFVSGVVSLYLIELLVIQVMLIVLLSIPMVIIWRLPNTEDVVEALSKREENKNRDSA